MYYKALQDKKIVDVYDDLLYVRYSKIAGMPILCKANDSPMGIVQRNGECIYHVDGWSEFPDGDYETVTLAEITAEDYEEILQKLTAAEDYSELEKVEIEDTTAPTPKERLEALEAQAVDADNAIAELSELIAAMQ